MTPAEELRTAAKTLRNMAEGTTGAPWLQVDCTVYPRWIIGTPQDAPDHAPDVAKVYDEGEDALQVGDADWRWMAFAHPGLAEPLAVLLEHIAEDMDGRNAVEGTNSKAVHPVSHLFGLDAPRLDWTAALAVARVINGGDR